MPKRKKSTNKEQNAKEEKKQSGGLLSSLGNLAGYVNPFSYISGNGEGDKEENEKLIENEDTENTKKRRKKKKKKKDKITEKDNYEENSAKIESGEVLEKGESLEKEKENEKENLDIDQIKKENEELIKKIDEYTKDTNIMYITTIDTKDLASNLNLEKHTELKSNVKDINNYCVYSRFANNNEIKDVGVIIFSSFLNDRTKQNKSTWQIIQEIMNKKFQNTIQFYDYNSNFEFKCSKFIGCTNNIERDLNTLYKYILEMVQNGKKITIPLDSKIESNDIKKEEINEIKKEEEKIEEKKKIDKKNAGNKKNETIYEDAEGEFNQENSGFRSALSELKEINENDKDNENNEGKEEQNENILDRENIEKAVREYEFEKELEEGPNLEIDNNINNINNNEPFNVKEEEIQKNDNDDEDELKSFIGIDNNKYKNGKFEKIKDEFKKTEDNDNNENENEDKINKSVIINSKPEINNKISKESLNKSAIIGQSKDQLEESSSKTNEKSDLQKENNDENVKQILPNLKSTKDLVNEFLNSVNKGTKGQVRECISEFYQIVCTNLQSLGINFTNVTKRDEYLKELKKNFKNDAKKIANKFPVWSFALADGLKDSHFYKRLNGEIDKDRDFIKINSKDKRSNIIKRFGKGFVNFFTGKPGKHKTIDQVNSVLKKYSEPWAIAWVLSREEGEPISENSMVEELDGICAEKDDNNFENALNKFLKKVGAKVKNNQKDEYGGLNDIFENASGSSKIKKRVKSIYKRLYKIHKNNEDYNIPNGNSNIMEELSDEKNKGFFSGFLGLFSRKKK